MGLPFETESYTLLIRMTADQAKEIILMDSDYNDAGRLKDSVRDQYKDKHSQSDFMNMNTKTNKREDSGSLVDK